MLNQQNGHFYSACSADQTAESTGRAFFFHECAAPISRTGTREIRASTCADQNAESAERAFYSRACVRAASADGGFIQERAYVQLAPIKTLNQQNGRFIQEREYVQLAPIKTLNQQNGR